MTLSRKTIAPKPTLDINFFYITDMWCMYLCIRTGMCISGATAVATEILGRIKYLFSMCCVFTKKVCIYIRDRTLSTTNNFEGPA